MTQHWGNFTMSTDDRAGYSRRGSSGTSAASGDEDTGEKITASKLRDVSRKEMDATRLYLKEIEHSELLTADEEKMYTRLAQKGCEKSRAKMIECNLRLVVKIARRYMNRGLALAQVFINTISAAGSSGLVSSISSYPA